MTSISLGPLALHARNLRGSAERHFAAYLSSNPHVHQTFPILPDNSPAQKLLKNLDMGLKMLRDGHCRELPATRERHRQLRLRRNVAKRDGLHFR